MNKGSVAALLFLLIGGISDAAVYKWVDDAGRVHYGDQPPLSDKAQSVAVPEEPAGEETEPPGPQLHELPARPAGEITRPGLAKKSMRATVDQEISFDKVLCFSPVSDVVRSPAAEAYVPITPTPLTQSQQASLRNLFTGLAAHWRGAITDLTCKGNAAEPTSATTHFEADATGDWRARQSQFVLEAEITGDENRSVQRMMLRFEVADALYFSDFKSEGSIALEGNKVELLTRHPGMVTFLINRRVATGFGGRLPHAEVRQLLVSGRSLRITELYYYNSVLTGRRSWVLDR